MSNDFTKDLSPYEDNNNNPIRGQYHFDIPQDIEPNAYEMNIDYESHDETKQDAYQYDGWIVVGHRPYFYAEPLIVPYNTLAVSEEAITSYEKFNTSFNAIVKAFEDSALQRIVKNLPYHLRVLKGQFKDYYENSDSVARTNIVNDYNTSSQIINVNMPQSTGSTGTGTTPLKVSNIYESSQTIQNYNTLFARCKGTRDRGTDNYVPGTLVIPLIIGTTRVYIRSLSDASLTVNKNISETGTVEPVAQVCGGGSISLIADLYYQWAMRSDTENDHMKYGYETWRTDPKKQVYVGAVKLQTNINGTWEDVPQSLIVPMNEATTILSDGSIVHTPNKIGRLQIRYTNPLPYMSQQSFKYRWTYKGKVGATFDNTSGELYFETSPNYGTETKIQSKVFRLINSRYEDSSSTMELWKGVDNHVTFYVQLKQGNTYQTSGGLAGVINYTFYGETGSAYVDSNGRTVISLPKEKKGTQIEMEYVPYSNNLQNYTTTFQIHYQPQDTDISLSNQGNRINLPPSNATSPDGNSLIQADQQVLITLNGAVIGNVTTTPDKIKVGICRMEEIDGNLTTIAKVDDVGIINQISENEFAISELNKNKMQTLINNMLNARECPFTSYRYDIQFTGNSDFLPAHTLGKDAKIIYPVTNGDWDILMYGSQEGDYIINSDGDINRGEYTPPTDPEGEGGEGFGYDYPESERSHVTIRHGEVLNILMRVKGNYINVQTNQSQTEKGLPCLKTNIQFYDYVYPIVTSTKTYPPRTPFEILYAPGEDGTIGVDSSVSNFDGKTDIYGRTIWKLKIPNSWSDRPNCEFRIRLQEKDEIEMSTQEIIIPLEII